MIWQNDALIYPHASRRSAIYARNGMVATSQPLAAQAGLEILKKGGNAIDAAIATAAVSTVVEPTGCGIGGDAFALVWINNNGKGKLHGLNASSVAPELLTPQAVNKVGFIEKMPMYGWVPVTVPGIPAAWASLSERCGELSFEDVLTPAIELAEKGFPVSPVISFLWERAVKNFDEVLEEDHIHHAIKESWFNTFASNGRAPHAGELFVAADHARTLQSIAQTKAESFYRGELAQKIHHFSCETGGYIRQSDLAAYHSEWVDPISINYRGYDIWQIPPNSQGLVVLMALNILKGLDLPEANSEKTLHHQIEAMKLAYTDGQAWITQRDKMPYSVEQLLTGEYAASRREAIGEKALVPFAGEPQSGGTVYLATADKDGNMVSFIQSNFHGFGSGVVVPGTGISLQNRGADFSLDVSHPNALQPGKKTFHTIIPGFITQHQQAIGVFGVMGAYMQPQGQLQVLSNMIDFGLNPQAALDAPRWQWLGDKTVGLEKEFLTAVYESLQKRGHDVHWAENPTSYGRGQIILRNAEGVLCGGTEKRTDGHIACY